MTASSQTQGHPALLRRFLLGLMLILSIFAFTPGEARADAADSELTGTLCKIINIIRGGVGRTIAIIVVMSIAIMMFLGKVTWGVAIMVAVGMGLLFGAPALVASVSPGGEAVCEETAA